MNNSTRSQGGWVASFVIIGAVLVLALLGGLYYVKSIQSGSNVADDTSSETVTDKNDQAKETPADTDNTADDDTASLEDADRANSDDATSDSSETPRANEPRTEDNEVDTSDDMKPEAEAPASDALPETGPEDVIMQLIATGMLTTAGVAYWQSRR